SPRSSGVNKLPLGHRDRIDMTAVIGFAAMRGTAEAEKPFRIGVGAVAKILDARDAGTVQPFADITGKVKQRMPGARRWREEAYIAGIGGEEPLHQLGAD